MPTINWSQRLETGIPDIDNQHKRLFQALNDLVEAFRRGDPKRQVARLIGFLAGNVVEHLQSEEASMREQAYPDLEAHLAEHQAFRIRVSELQRRHEAGARLRVEVAILLADWLAYHIGHSDRAFAEHARRIRIFRKVG